MSINRRSNGTVNFFIQTLILGHFPKLLFLHHIIIFCFCLHAFDHVINFNESCQKREPMLNVDRIFKPVYENTDNFNLIPRSCDINVVTKNYNLLASRNSTRQYVRWRLLYCYFLVVSVYGFLFIDNERSIRLARCTMSQLCIVNIVDVEWPFWLTTFRTTISDFFHLRKNLTSNCDNSLH